MTTAKKRAANRLNAQKSTGPKSAEGKARVAQNAITHGLFARHQVLAGESHEEFDELREALIEHDRPQNVMELLLVERIVDAQWKLIRLAKAEEEQIADDAQAMRHAHEKQAHWMTRELRNGFYESDHDMTREQFTARRDAHQKLAATKPSAARVLASGFASDEKSLHRIAIYEQRLERSILRAASELRKMRKDAKESEELPASPYGKNCERRTGERGTGAPPVILTQNQNTGEAPVPRMEQKVTRENVKIKATAPAQPIEITLRPSLASTSAQCFKRTGETPMPRKDASDAGATDNGPLTTDK